MSGLLVAVAVCAFLLPLLGELGGVSFAVPMAVLAYAAHRCEAASRRNPAARTTWRLLASAAALGAGASALAVVSLLAGAAGTAAFYAGALASLALLAAVADLARRSLAGVALERLLDAILGGVLIAGLSVYFVAIPGFAWGDPVLTSVFVIDLAALLIVSLAAMARRGGRHARVVWPLAAVCAGATAGDALVALTAADRAPSIPFAVAALWALAGYMAVVAADVESPERGSESAVGDAAAIGNVNAKVMLPFAAVLSVPVVASVLWALDAWSPWTLSYFGSLFVGMLVLAFARQAFLLSENERAASRERCLRQEVTRRNEELEALTGLATTMTQTLEESPIVERGLEVLHLAARATSSALHGLPDVSTNGSNGGIRLLATIGAWDEEHPWTRPVPVESARIETRGGRQIAQLPLAARGSRIATVTLVRPAQDAFEGEEIGLLGLLTDQLAIAVQNARDYRDKLEQAIRDPLTGAYNRRFLYETLEKEVERSNRHGSTASLVLFDIDNFKQVNDSYGHATGDDALRSIVRIVHEEIRKGDSFARVGGEEFALLLPETGLIDAQRVADRVRAAIARHRVLDGRRVTVSGGISACPGDATNVDELTRKADAALYWAKRNGKNLCVVAGEIATSEPAARNRGTLTYLQALVAVLDDEHLHTRGHSQNVAAYTVALAGALGVDGDRQARLRYAALLHDIGKVAVSAATLMKPAKLDSDEWAEIQLHPSVGATMLLHAGLTEEALWVKHHHERMDGGGYPDGLVGEAIPFEARIIFVADAFEAMTSDRPYRKGMDVESALAELQACAGTQFDPVVVQALAELVASERLTISALRA